MSSDVPCDLSTSSSSTTHVEAVGRVRENIREMLTRDPVLRDVGVGVPVELLTAEDLDALIALETGQAMSVTVERANATKFKVVVRENANVADLKSAIKRAVVVEQVDFFPEYSTKLYHQSYFTE
jgi:hypothetical protein